MTFGNSEDEHDFFDLCNDLRYIEHMTECGSRFIARMWIIYRYFFNHFLYIRNDHSIFFIFRMR